MTTLPKNVIYKKENPQVRATGWGKMRSVCIDKLLKNKQCQNSHWIRLYSNDNLRTFVTVHK